MNRFIYLAIPILFLLVTSCAGLKLNPPSPGKQAILVLPVRVTNTAERTSRHGFYYIYEIISDPEETISLDTRVIPYEAVFKLPIKGDMLIVDSLPPGNYLVDKFTFKPVGSGDFTYGNNVFPRNDKFKLETGKLTIFSKSLEVSLYNKIPGRGSETSYAFNMVSVSPDQKEEILATLKDLPNFYTWEILASEESVQMPGVQQTTSTTKLTLPPCPDNFISGEPLKYPDPFKSDCFGAQYFSSGDIYVGEFKDNVPHGRGELTYDDGSYYIGEFKNGKRDGQGAFTDANGVIIKGKWDDDEFLHD